MHETTFSPADEPELVDRLVAYLDGELDTEGCRQIESLLTTDPQVRAKLQQLEQTWNLLDQLPRAELDSSFTATTVEMVALSAAEDVAQVESSRPGRVRRAWLLGAVGAMVAAVAGFFTTDALWTHPNDQLLKDLTVLENLDAYRQVDDIELLRKLWAEGVFTENFERAAETEHGS
jgi:anti-sigma factor RsiW